MEFWPLKYVTDQRHNYLSMYLTIENWNLKSSISSAVYIQENILKYIANKPRMVTQENVCIPNNAKIQIACLVIRCKGKTHGA